MDRAASLAYSSKQEQEPWSCSKCGQSLQECICVCSKCSEDLVWCRCDDDHDPDCRCSECLNEPSCPKCGGPDNPCTYCSFSTRKSRGKTTAHKSRVKPSAARGAVGGAASAGAPTWVLAPIAEDDDVPNTSVAPASAGPASAGLASASAAPPTPTWTLGRGGPECTPGCSCIWGGLCMDRTASLAYLPLAPIVKIQRWFRGVRPIYCHLCGDMPVPHLGAVCYNCRRCECPECTWELLYGHMFEE